MNRCWLYFQIETDLYTIKHTYPSYWSLTIIRDVCKFPRTHNTYQSIIYYQKDPRFNITEKSLNSVSCKRTHSILGWYPFGRNKVLLDPTKGHPHTKVVLKPFFYLTSNILTVPLPLLFRRLNYWMWHEYYTHRCLCGVARS